MALKYKCPECNKTNLTKHLSVLETVICPNCRAEIIIPDDAEAVDFAKEIEKISISRDEAAQAKANNSKMSLSSISSEEENEELPGHKKEGKHGCLITIIILVVMIFIGSQINKSPDNKYSSSKSSSTTKSISNESPDNKYSSSKSSSTTKSISNATAYRLARNYVRGQLVSPSTAKFPVYLDAKIINIGNNTFEVYCYVDAQNRMGVSLRMYYECTLQVDSSGKTADVLFFAFTE